MLDPSDISLKLYHRHKGYKLTICGENYTGEHFRH